VSHELFTYSGLEPQSSQSKPPKQLGLQAWVTGAQLLSSFLMLFKAVYTNAHTSFFHTPHSGVLSLSPDPLFFQQVSVPIGTMADIFPSFLILIAGSVLSTPPSEKWASPPYL
jgi:hypothetical protein